MAPPGVYLDGEVPLNQEDLAITLGIFGYLNLRRLSIQTRKHLNRQRRQHTKNSKLRP
jgi:hypothetical protein